MLAHSFPTRRSSDLERAQRGDASGGDELPLAVVAVAGHGIDLRRGEQQDWVWGMSQGGIRTSSPGLRMVTVLLLLETSIPTAFMIKTPLK